MNHHFGLSPRETLKMLHVRQALPPSSIHELFEYKLGIKLLPYFCMTTKVYRAVCSEVVAAGADNKESETNAVCNIHSTSVLS